MKSFNGKFLKYDIDIGKSKEFKKLALPFFVKHIYKGAACTNHVNK